MRTAIIACVVPLSIGLDMADISAELGDAFGRHLGQRLPSLVLEVPFLGDDGWYEPIKLDSIFDQLGDRTARVTLHRHPSDVEYDGSYGTIHIR